MNSMTNLSCKANLSIVLVLNEIYIMFCRNDIFSSIYGCIGVWFMHCHLELHTGWGLKMAFVVEDGPEQDQSVLLPPKDLPAC